MFAQRPSYSISNGEPVSPLGAQGSSVTKKWSRDRKEAVETCQWMACAPWTPQGHSFIVTGNTNTTKVQHLGHVYTIHFLFDHLYSRVRCLVAGLYLDSSERMAGRFARIHKVNLKDIKSFFPRFEAMWMVLLLLGVHKVIRIVFLCPSISCALFAKLVFVILLRVVQCLMFAVSDHQMFVCVCDHGLRNRVSMWW